MFENLDRYDALSQAAEVPSKVGGLTHDFYRYPARFGDAFVREAILQFSNSNDLVLDPFCGGGTTIVEALANGRRGIGSDISPLSLFISKVKTTPLSSTQLDSVGEWVSEMTKSTRTLMVPSVESDDHRLTGLHQPFRNMLSNLRGATDAISHGESRDFARCLLLRAAQWAFDGRQRLPRPKELVNQLPVSFHEMSSGMVEFRNALGDTGLSKRQLLGRRNFRLLAAKFLTGEKLGLGRSKVSLVVTSPPYLGVHVLYNKWQLAGRKELRTPFYLADLEDIGGASKYTIIERRAKVHAKYYAEIEESFRAVAALLKRGAFVIQLVSFSDAERALPHYLSALKRAGLELCETYVRAGLKWRSVPRRRWYARVKAIEDSSASREVLLVHRRRSHKNGPG